MNANVNEQIFEIRYKANSKILDYRGTWSELLSDYLGLSEWKIVDNRIDIYNKQNTRHAFVGFSNTGFLCTNSPTRNFFYDQASKFYSFIVKQPGYDAAPQVERFGVRSRFCINIDKSFKDIMELYLKSFCNQLESIKNVLGPEYVDIGTTLELKDKLGNYKLTSGAVELAQIKNLFRNIEEENSLPQVGLYFDLDYWVKPNKAMSEGDICGLLKQFSETSWEKIENLVNTITGS